MRKAMLGVALVSTILGMAIGCGAGADSAEESLGAEESELSTDGGGIKFDANSGCVVTGDASVPPRWDGGGTGDGGGPIADGGGSGDSGVAIPRLSGVWGGDNVSLSVVKGVATLELPCAEGVFVAPVVTILSTDAGAGSNTKYFYANGTFHSGVKKVATPAWFNGFIANGVMTLQVYPDSGGSTSYTLKRDVVSAFPRCY